MKAYDDLVYTRDEELEGLDDWLWIKSDTGAWDGPKGDWVNCHKKHYFAQCKKFDVVVQAGGNQGMYPRLLAQMFKVVYTFEPDPLNFHCLVNNCQEDNVIKMQAVLGDSHKMVVVNRETMVNTGCHRVVEGRGAIPQLRLDDFEFETLDALLLDVEGYELRALLGARETLAKHHPVVAIELGDRPDIEAFMTELGYRVYKTSASDTVYCLRSPPEFDSGQR